eukprot:TRINITY_DN2786_c0_g1_i6.p1 TRINITY_DN2786_c0_g1~~TRINITY_DN2786_c0_g1_i6.p1  ORF type:complete len:734 (-),score=136.84 TRINITY_DN2786_c0_g1_i6:615-2816(-)
MAQRELPPVIAAEWVSSLPLSRFHDNIPGLLPTAGIALLADLFATRAAAANLPHAGVYKLFAPPGVGKTRTFVEAAGKAGGKCFIVRPRSCRALRTVEGHVAQLAATSTSLPYNKMMADLRPAMSRALAQLFYLASACLESNEPNGTVLDENGPRTVSPTRSPASHWIGKLQEQVAPGHFTLLLFDELQDWAPPRDYTLLAGESDLITAERYSNYKLATLLLCLQEHAHYTRFFFALCGTPSLSVQLSTSAVRVLNAQVGIVHVLQADDVRRLLEIFLNFKGANASTALFKALCGPFRLVEFFLEALKALYPTVATSDELDNALERARQRFFDDLSGSRALSRFPLNYVARHMELLFMFPASFGVHLGQEGKYCAPKSKWDPLWENLASAGLLLMEVGEVNALLSPPFPVVCQWIRTLVGPPWTNSPHLIQLAHEMEAAIVCTEDNVNIKGYVLQKAVVLEWEAYPHSTKFLTAVLHNLQGYSPRKTPCQRIGRMCGLKDAVDPATCYIIHDPPKDDCKVDVCVWAEKNGKPVRVLIQATTEQDPTKLWRKLEDTATALQNRACEEILVFCSLAALSPQRLERRVLDVRSVVLDNCAQYFSLPINLLCSGNIKEAVGAFKTLRIPAQDNKRGQSEEVAAEVEPQLKRFERAEFDPLFDDNNKKIDVDWLHAVLASKLHDPSFATKEKIERWVAGLNNGGVTDVGSLKELTKEDLDSCGVACIVSRKLYTLCHP